MTLPQVLFLLLGVFVYSIQATNNEGVFDVAAFNVQVFGVTKMSNAEVRKYLRDIVLRYDLILIQEIRDASGDAIKELLADVQAIDARYDMTISPRLGRTSSKEQYAFIYRTDWVNALNSFLYSDPGDVYEREPYVVRFKSSKAEISDFAIAGIHTSPDDAEIEVSNLSNVYDEIVVKFGLKDVIIMGDFNAGCDYIKNWKNVKLATDNRFYWLIDNTVDTTTKQTECPYDRVVVAGDKLLASLLPLSPGAFRYDTYYKLSEELAEDISDHYPVQFQIRSLEKKLNILSVKEIYVDDTRVNTDLTSYKVYSMKGDAEDISSYKVSSSYTKSGAYLKIVVSKNVKGVGAVMQCLENDFKKDFPTFITTTQILTAEGMLNEMDIRHRLPHGFGRYQTLYDFYASYEHSYSVKLACSLEIRTAPICYVNIVQYFK
ncbi:deoxyribonuclease-1-like [Hydractinia symbiolongicarpus]|uniref:deoxyribonuclease-1-like n=1 Tax=Hydractinia symbiolongicarpus TaxID=13093 RepID=UPI00254D121A|nr:deoxyribonuclease-1-like [Hydractinia symbiolongicarpus]